MRLSVLTGLLVSLLLAAACGDDDPCDSYTGSSVCDKIKAVVEPKCGTFDCKTWFVGCKMTQKFCADGIDKCVADIKAAKDCNAVANVTCALSCYD